MALPQTDKCGANELLDNVQNKAEDIKSKITEQLGLGADASTIRDNLKVLLAPLEQVMTEVAPKLAAIPPVSLQGGIKDFISGFDAKKLATPSGKNEAASKLALLEKDFGPKLKDKGLTLNDLIKKAGVALGQDIDVSSINAGITKDVGAAASFLSGTGTGSLTGELTSALGGTGSAGNNLLGGLTGGGTNPLTNFGSIGDKLGLGGGSVQETNAGLLSTVTSLTGGGLEGNAAGLTALKNTATGAPLSFCEISAGQGGFTIPNIQIPADLSGSGVTEEEREVRSSTGLLVIAIKDEYKEIKSVEGKREGSPFFTNIQGYKVDPNNSGIILLPSYKEGDKNWAEVVVKYIVELVKEKSVEITQADTNEAKEKIAPITTSINSISKKKEFNINSLLGKLSNLSLSSLPANEIKKTEIRDAIDKAQGEISDPAYKSKVDAHVKKSFGELGSFLQNPQKYRSVPIKSGDGEITQTEVVTTKDSIIETTNEVTGVKTVEKAAVAEKGFLNRPREISKKFQTKVGDVGVVKDDPTGIIWSLKYADSFDPDEFAIKFKNITPKIHEVKKIHAIEFDNSGEIKHEYFYLADDGSKEDIKFFTQVKGSTLGIRSVAQSNSKANREKYLQIQTLNRHQSISSFPRSRVSGKIGVVYTVQGDNDPDKGKSKRMNLPKRVDGSIMPYQEFGDLYGDYTPRKPQLPLPEIAPPVRINAIAVTYTTLEKLNPK